MMRVHYTINGSTVVPDGSIISESNPNEIIFPTGEKILVGPCFTKIAVDTSRRYEFDIVRDDWTAEFRIEEQIDDVVLELTDPLPEENLLVIRQLMGLPHPNDFASLVMSFKRSFTNVYDLKFMPRERPQKLYQSLGDKPYFTTEEIEDVVERYTRLCLQLKILVAKGYIVQWLRMVHKDGKSGITFGYATANHQLYTLEYVRDTGPEAMIPDDFLKDLSNLKSNF